MVPARGRLPETQKSGVERITQHRLTKSSERNTIDPFAHAALAKNPGHRYNEVVVQPLAVVLSGMNTLHRGMAGCSPLCPAANLRFHFDFTP